MHTFIFRLHISEKRLTFFQFQFLRHVQTSTLNMGGNYCHPENSICLTNNRISRKKPFKSGCHLTGYQYYVNLSEVLSVYTTLPNVVHIYGSQIKAKNFIRDEIHFF